MSLTNTDVGSADVAAAAAVACSGVTSAMSGANMVGADRREAPKPPGRAPCTRAASVAANDSASKMREPRIGHTCTRSVEIVISKGCSHARHGDSDGIHYHRRPPAFQAFQHNQFNWVLWVPPCTQRPRPYEVCVCYVRCIRPPAAPGPPATLALGGGAPGVGGPLRIRHPLGRTLQILASSLARVAVEI